MAMVVEKDVADVLVPVRVASRRTGLSPHVIRVWERRYGAVRPVRSGTNRRLYCPADLERLRLLRDAVACGHSIQDVAGLSDERLSLLLADDRDSGREAGRVRAGARGDAVEVADGIAEDGIPGGSDAGSDAGSWVSMALDAARDFDEGALRRVLAGARVRFGHYGAIVGVLSPLAVAIGDLWRRGELRIAHEHFVSAHLRRLLMEPSPAYGSGEAGRLVVATPVGQVHELGAMMAYAAAVSHGWAATYLGVSLPAEEIAWAAASTRASCVALSLVYPGGDERTASDLRLLGDLLPGGVPVVVGGQAVPAYADVLNAIGARRVADLSGMVKELDRLSGVCEARDRA